MSKSADDAHHQDVNGDRNAFWTTKYQEVQRYSHEHNEVPSWYRHEKHVIAFTNSGRPIFTRFGDESKLAQFVGIVSLIAENFDKLGDKLRLLKAGNYKFVFLHREKITLLCITRTNETTAQIQRQLEYAYLQMVSVVSGKLNYMLKCDPKIEVRNYLAGTELLLSDLIDDANRSFGLTRSCYQPLPIAYKVRSKIYSLLKSATSKLKQHHVMSLLICDQRIVCFQRLNMKSGDGKDAIFVEDLHVLLNLFSNSQSLRTATDSWAPIFLPRLSPASFICCYMSYLTSDTCLAILTRNHADFDLCRDARLEFVKNMTSKNLMESLNQAGNLARTFSVDNVVSSVPDLRHFIFYSQRCHQYISTAIVEPFIVPTAWDLGNHELMRRYRPIMNYLLANTVGTDDQRQYATGSYFNANNMKQEASYPIAIAENLRALSSSLIEQDPRHSVCFQVADDASVLAIVKPGEYEMYLTYTPLVSKELALFAAQKVMLWVTKEYDDIFNID